MPGRRKQEIVTFKVDEPLWEAMKGIPNRSEFIRAAILSALDSVCPLCKGSGILTPDQRRVAIGKLRDAFAEYERLKASGQDPLASH